MADYYQILEVSPDASQETIKEQYRFLVQAWHPDRFSSPSQKLKAEEKIKEVNTAYQILGDPAKREEYDKKNRFSRSSNEQKYYEQSRQRQSEDVQRRKEEAARRAKKEQWQREHVDRGRKEAEKRRAEIERKERIIQLDQEINKLSNRLPKMQTPIFGILLFIGGFYAGYFSLALLASSENIGFFFVFIIAMSFIISINQFSNRNKFYREKYKPAFNEVDKRKQRLQQLIRERHYLK